ncbi:MAG TPA: hypothetical protein ENI98_08965 [Gammaproteobacteria bacterium]|nr:hypothetical protein [Gammaproteobacteria bacterium]
MALTTLTALHDFLQHSEHPATTRLREKLAKASKSDYENIISIYQEAIPLVEKTLWSGKLDDDFLSQYQQIFRELEAHIHSAGEDQRHHIVLLIPVADRPQQLTDCLNSLLKLCRKYHYGGVKNSRYQKITVLIADDSKAADNIRKHKAIVDAFNADGLESLYFGQEEQLQQLSLLTEQDRQALVGVLGKTETLRFYHKGSSRMRNITSLKLKELQQRYDKILFYSLDSDQEFQIKVATHEGDRNVYALNYFYYLDQIFSRTNTCIVTGKVVGDPPVSPAVMAVNFVRDVISFIQQMAALEQQQDCCFHFTEPQESDAAAYHDMREMFGFKNIRQSYHYPCPLTGQHNNSACFRRFAEKLNGFFYGEHPTRKVFYTYKNTLDSIAPARTVYPGNYIFNAEGLNYFIPFAPLKLRMNGPVMGRVIKTILKDRFISTNLPMLHKRTVGDSATSEFRPDILQQSRQIDIAGEFERQYLGDVMLFSMEALTEQGYPLTRLDPDTVTSIVKATEKNIHQQYLGKHKQLITELDKLRTLLHTPECWWNQAPDLNTATAAFDDFIANIEHNFGDASYGYKFINSAADKQPRMQQIIEAILLYPDAQKEWEQMLSVKNVSAGIR